MFDAGKRGNIFPTQDGTSNINYISNKINSNESKIRQYHQLEIAMDKDWVFAMTSKDGKDSIGLLEYLQDLLR